MRLLDPKAVFALLIGTAGLCTIAISPVFADTPPAAPHLHARIQIQCTVIRARSEDFDALGINCILMPSEHVSANGLPQKAAETPRFAAVTLGPDAERAIRSLAKQPGSVVKTFSLTMADGQPGIFSLAGLKDPGVSAGSRLSVTPQRRSNGAITLSIVPLFNFVLLPGHGNPAVPVSVEAFFLRPTLSNGSLLAFTVFPKSKPGMRFGEMLPLIPAPSDPWHEDPDETQLWIFLSATLLPSEKGDR